MANHRKIIIHLITEILNKKPTRELKLLLQSLMKIETPQQPSSSSIAIIPIVPKPAAPAPTPIKPKNYWGAEGEKFTSYSTFVNYKKKHFKPLSAAKLKESKNKKKEYSECNNHESEENTKPVFGKCRLSVYIENIETRIGDGSYYLYGSEDNDSDDDTFKNVQKILTNMLCNTQLIHQEFKHKRFVNNVRGPAFVASVLCDLRLICYLDIILLFEEILNVQRVAPWYVYIESTKNYYLLVSVDDDAEQNKKELLWREDVDATNACDDFYYYFLEKIPEMFKFLYKKKWGHNNYNFDCVFNNTESPHLTSIFVQLLRNMYTLKRQDEFYTYIQTIVKKQCVYHPDKTDLFFTISGSGGRTKKSTAKTAPPSPPPPPPSESIDFLCINTTALFFDNVMTMQEMESVHRGCNQGAPPPLTPFSRPPAGAEGGLPPLFEIV